MNTLRKNSLHFRLANTYGTFDIPTHWDIEDGDWVDSPTNFCLYARGVLIGTLVVLCIMVFGGVFAGLTVGDAIAWLFALVSQGHFIKPNPGALIAIGIALGVTLLFIWIYTKVKFIEPWKEARRNKKMQESTFIKEPTFLGTWYKSLKDKTCFTIKFID